jgi:hypothetical protein
MAMLIIIIMQIIHINMLSWINQENLLESQVGYFKSFLEIK